MFSCLKMVNKSSYLISTQTETQFLSGSLFSSRVLELLRCEHFGENGLCDTAGIYFRCGIFPLTAGKPVCCQTLQSMIRSELWRKL